MLSKISQIDIDKYSMISLICETLKKIKPIETENIFVVARGSRWRWAWEAGQKRWRGLRDANSQIYSIRNIVNNTTVILYSDRLLLDFVTVSILECTQWCHCHTLLHI